MKFVFKSRAASFLTWCGYAVGAIVGWALLRVPGVVVGLAFGYVVDRLTPRYVTELTWRDLSRAVENLYNHGVVGSRIFIVLADRSLIVFRDIFKNKTRMGIQIPVSQWADFIDEDGRDVLLQNGGGYVFEQPWKGRQYLSVKATPEVDGVMSLLRKLLGHDGSAIGSILARVDYSKADIWRMDGAERG